MPPTSQAAAQRPVVPILLARSRIFRRWLHEHAFVLFVLGPILVGSALWATERQLLALRAPLIDAMTKAEMVIAIERATVSGWIAWTPTPQSIPFLALALGLAALLWPGTVAELYGRGQPGHDLLDALPVAEAQRFLASAVAVLVRGVVPSLLLLGALEVLRDADSARARTMATIEVLGTFGWVVLAVSVLAVVNLVAALILAHAGWLDGRRLMVLGAAALVALAVPALHIVLVPWWATAELLRRALWRVIDLGGLRMDVTGATDSGWLAVAAGQLTICLALAGVLSVRWRRRDMERAARIERSGPAGTSRMHTWLAGPRVGDPQQWTGRLARLDPGPAVRAALRRDLRMILRRFSPAVPVAGVTAVLVDLIALGLVRGGVVAPDWHAEVLVTAATLSTFAVASLVPFLLAHQLPRLWIERSTGVEPVDVWRAKAILAGLLAIPALLAGLILLAVSLPPAEAFLAGLQLLAAGTVVSSMVGAAVFEIAEEPHLSLLLAGFAGMALALMLILYPRGTVLWLAAWGWALGKMVERGARRVTFTVIPR